MPPSRASAACGRDCGGTPAPAGQSRPRKGWIGVDDWRAESLRLLLLSQLAEGLLGVPDIVGAELARFDQMRHHRLRTAAEQAEQIVQKSSHGGAARRHGFENVS